MSASNSTENRPRLASLDQFRGYTIVGMCVANFLAPFAAIHAIFKHNDTYFSYADSIMPSFLFVVGFSFRLTYVKRRRKLGLSRTAWTYVRRSLVLLLLSLGIYLFIGDIPRWFAYRAMPAEFEPYRAMPRRTTSFDLLRAEAKKREPASEEAAIVAAASRIGKTLSEAEVDKDGTIANGAVARAGEERALRELQPLLPAAVERVRRWESLDGLQKLAVHLRIRVAKLVKSEIWETLAIIAVTQLVVLPWVGTPFWMRLAALAIFGAVHAFLAYWFDWDFVYAVPGNWMSKVWMTGDDRSWDGGIFGPLCWALVMLAGTLAYDLVAKAATSRRAFGRLAMWGAAFMGIGWGLSCLTRLYDLSPAEFDNLRRERQIDEAEKDWLSVLVNRQQKELTNGQAKPAEAERIKGFISLLEDQSQGYADHELAVDPVLPGRERYRGRQWFDLLAEPPFVAPPRDAPGSSSGTPSGSPVPPGLDHRLRNYWMMGKRMPSVSYMAFATGFAFAALSIFVLACDGWGWGLGVFRTFGTNPLAAYFAHGFAGVVMFLTIPHDASLLICLSAFTCFFLLTYWLVRFLEKRGLYWRL